MKLIPKIFSAFIFFIVLIHNTYGQNLYKSHVGNINLGLFANSGLGPGLPLFIGIEKYYSLSNRVIMAGAQDLAYVKNKKYATTYYVSSSKFNIHFQLKKDLQLDTYIGFGYNYLLQNSGYGAEYFDSYLGYQFGARYYFDDYGGVGVFLETGTGKYVHFGFCFGV